MSPSGAPVVEIESLSLEFVGESPPSAVLRGVSLSIGAGEMVGLVGESGSGKSVTALAVLQLLPKLKVRYSAGSRIAVLGRDVLGLPEELLRGMRGAEVSMIFQEPMTALNPVLRIDRQIGEVLRRHRCVSAAEALELSVARLAEMSIADPARVLASYPHELSGGLRQRVMIGR